VRFPRIGLVVLLPATVVCLSAAGAGAAARGGARAPVLPRTTLPIVYHINYSGDYFTKPDYINPFRAAPPDLLHVGKAVPISHHWGRGRTRHLLGPPLAVV